MLLLTGFSLGCLSIIFLIVARDFGYLPVARVFLALLAAAAAFLLNYVVAPEWRWLTADIMTMLPALFWLLCQMAFARRPHLISIWAALALYSFIAPSLYRHFLSEQNVSQTLQVLALKLPSYTEYVVILQGMWVVIANWSDDLVAPRRKLRAAMLGIVGVASLWITISLNSGHGSLISLSLVVAIAALIVATLLLTGRKGVLLGPMMLTDAAKDHIKVVAIPESVYASDEACDNANSDNANNDDELNEGAVKLQRVMDEGFYRKEKMTLSKLAEEIDLPEYKTRALINETLGYRNFNDYINQLRIAEAGARLLAEPETPIHNIALDVGYRTLSSFNRAFKEILQQTPTGYRQ